MADELTIRPERRRLSSDTIGEARGSDALNHIQAVQNAVAAERGEESSFGGDAPIKMKGNPPPQMLAALEAIRSNQLAGGEADEADNFQPPRPRQGDRHENSQRPRQQNQFSDPRPRPINEQLEALLNQLKGTTHMYSSVELPSKGKFYDGSDGPENGILHLRSMTGEEEQILATPRLMRGNKAIDMIFRNCIQERFNPEKLLTIDRNYILIYLRGISYGNNYDVEIKCQECNNKFATTVDLDRALDVEHCPDDFDVNSLSDTLPVSGFRFSYRLSRGRDDTAVLQYREKKMRDFADASDDTLAYRAALLLTEIEGITDNRQLQMLHRQLPIGDVSYIRNVINEPPFGVNTELPMLCPFCYAEFNTDLPLDTNFFFPKPKKKEAPSN